MWFRENVLFTSHFLRIINYVLRVQRNCSVKNNSENICNESSLSDFPEPPSTCCMSACANCVWINYANKLNAIFRDGGENSLKIINEKIEDPNMKAFLITEVKIACRKK